VIICCGKGNNGGDGFVIARHLDIAGVPVRVLLFANPEKLEGDAAINHRILALSGIPVEVRSDEAGLSEVLAGADWVVDALFGTGLTGPPRSPLDRVIEAINASGRPVLAVDCPSGLDVDTGRPIGACIRATLTATVFTPKVGFDAPEAGQYLGEVVVVGMGAPRVLLEDGLRGTSSFGDGEA
jgi:NAD(P)H-hydrate epimerase